MPGWPSTPVLKIHEGRPNIEDAIKNSEIQLIINTPVGSTAQEDDRSDSAHRPGLQGPHYHYHCRCPGYGLQPIRSPARKKTPGGENPSRNTSIRKSNQT